MRPSPPRSLNNAVMSAQLTQEERGSDILGRKGEDGTFEEWLSVCMEPPGKKEASGLKPHRGSQERGGAVGWGGYPFVQT